MRDIPLNKSYIYRILITEYKSHIVISSSSTVENTDLESINEYILKHDIEDVMKCTTLINTGLRLSKMFRMTLKEKTTCHYHNNHVYYNANLKKYYIKEHNEIICYCKISDVLNGYGNIVVWTNESYRRNGLAKMLLLLTINKCHDDRIEPLYLVNSENVASLALAKSIGFQVMQTEYIACEIIDT